MNDLKRSHIKRENMDGAGSRFQWAFYQNQAKTVCRNQLTAVDTRATVTSRLSSYWGGCLESGIRGWQNWRSKNWYMKILAELKLQQLIHENAGRTGTPTTHAGRTTGPTTNTWKCWYNWWSNNWYMKMLVQLEVQQLIHENSGTIGGPIIDKWKCWQRWHGSAMTYLS